MSVRKRLLGDGEVRWLVDYKDGGGDRRAKQFTTKREAEAFHVKARGEVTAGIHTPDAASITVAQAADRWLARCEREGLEPASVLDYRAHLKLHIIPFIGSTKLSRLTVPILNAFRDQLLDFGAIAGHGQAGVEIAGGVGRESAGGWPRRHQQCPLPRPDQA